MPIKPGEDFFLLMVAHIDDVPPAELAKMLFRINQVIRDYGFSAIPMNQTQTKQFLAGQDEIIQKSAKGKDSQ